MAPTRRCWCCPPDHLIRDAAGFAAAVERCASLARARDGSPTFGIVPTRPETGYGYIQFGEALDVANTFRVDRFIEKAAAGRRIRLRRYRPTSLEFRDVLLHPRDSRSIRETFAGRSRFGAARLARR